VLNVKNRVADPNGFSCHSVGNSRFLRNDKKRFLRNDKKNSFISAQSVLPLYHTLFLSYTEKGDNRKVKRTLSGTKVISFSDSPNPFLSFYFHQLWKTKEYDIVSSGTFQTTIVTMTFLLPESYMN
jgi:hypothetical protein